MTSNRSRWAVALMTMLAWSVVLGAAMPAAAGSSPSGGGAAVHHSLDLGDTVGDTLETVTGDGDETNASSEGGDSGPNATETAEPDNGSISGVVDRTTGGLEETVDEIVQTRTPAQTAEADETSTPTGVPTTPIPSTEPVSSTPTPTQADDADDEADSLVGTTADVVDGVGTGTAETVNGTTDTVQETTDTTARTVENTSNDTGSTVDETVRTATGNDSGAAERVDGVTDLTNETVESTTRTADETVRTAGAATDGVANATADTGSSNGSTGDHVAGTAGGVTRTVDATVAGTVDTTSAVTTSVDETTSSTTELFDGRNGTVARLAGNVTSTVDRATGGLTAVVDDTARTVERTTDAVTDGVDGTAETTGRLVDGTVEGDVTGGLLGPRDEGSENVEDYGWPTEESGSSSDDDSSTSAEPAGAGVAPDSAVPGQIALTEASSSEAPDGEPKADETASSTDEGVLPPLEEVDPAAGGAIAGALLVSGSVLATRAGMTASSMGAGAATLPQLLFAMLKEFALRLAVLAGYSRYDFSDPLENENRATVLETVEASPGINLTSLVEETGLAESTVRYHVQVLEHEGLLEAAKVRGRRRFVPQTNEDVELVAAFEEEATRDVIDALFEHEPATGTTLAEALDRDPSTVSHHLSRLSEAGLVEREQDGPALRNSLSADVRTALSDVEVTASVQQHVQADD